MIGTPSSERASRCAARRARLDALAAEAPARKAARAAEPVALEAPTAVRTDSLDVAALKAAALDAAALEATRLAEARPAPAAPQRGGAEAPQPGADVAMAVHCGGHAVVRDAGHCRRLHGEQCFGHVRVIPQTEPPTEPQAAAPEPPARQPGAEARRGPARDAGARPARREFKPPVVELRLTLEEEYYLVSRGRLRVAREAPSNEAPCEANSTANETWRDCCDRAASGEARFVATYSVYAHFRDQGFVVKGGLQFGADFLLYRGTPDEVHAEFVAYVLPHGSSLAWARLKTLARLAQDVKKAVLVCHAPASLHGITAVLRFDDAFMQPPDACMKKKRLKSLADAATQNKKRPRPDAEEEW